MPMHKAAVCVEIGGIPISLSTSDPGFLELLQSRYAGFLSSSSPQFELEFDLIPPGPASDHDVRVRMENREWTIERGDFQARWNPQTGRGKVRQNSNPY